MIESFAMRVPCKRCGSTEGYITTRNGQDCVFCSVPWCNRFQYNAPKVETGRASRTVTTIHNGIKPKERIRILERATGRCEICGAKGNLHVGHLLSVENGLKSGMTEYDLNSDENLAAMCEECNLGIGKSTVSLRLSVSILRARLKEVTS